ncbi:CaiB/BaiF CoA transferase family protein [Chloroflexota bacterium]
MGPLSGIRVLDISRAIAGPYGSMILGDLGAEVIKIETPEGDFSRVSAGPSHKGENFYYLAFNRNKKDIVLDLFTKSGREAFYDLVKVSDIVWNNFRTGSMERLGADYDTLREINPKVIYCSITGYGPTGPSKDRPAYDIAILAASGILSVTGEPDGRPVRPGVPIADEVGALFAVIGTLAALAERQRTGRGQKIDISLMDACISLLGYPLSYYFTTSIVPRLLGNSGHLILVPYGVYKTKKDYIALGVCWPRIARALSADWLADDPRFKDLQARQEHRDELNAIIEEHLAKAEADDWMEIFKVEDIAAAKVVSLDEVAVDPQVLHQKMILNMEHPLGGEIKLVGNPIKVGGISEEEFTPPPTLNQHQRQILSELLGYSDEKIRGLREEEAENTVQRLQRIQKVL